MINGVIKKACVFGAGKMGCHAIDSLKEYNYKFFCDNDKNKVGTIVNGYTVRGFDELKRVCAGEDDIEVFIAGYVHEIYEQCIRNEIKVMGVYSPEQNKIVTYREYCILDKKFYCNDLFIEYSYGKKIRIQKNITRFMNGERMSECITEVAIELSNLCNYACIHSKCPASHIKEKIIMPLSDIRNIIKQLCEIDFKGTICFQIYNEPLIDPRLFFIIELIKQKLTDIKILVYTNGYYLTESLGKDLQNGFADIIVATGYGEEEYRRLININVEIPYYVLWGKLDERISWKSKESKSNAPCASLFSQVPIWANGDLGLCCMDCFQKIVFGNIKKTDIKRILNSTEIRKSMESLLKGDREDVNFCANCEWEGIPL